MAELIARGTATISFTRTIDINVEDEVTDLLDSQLSGSDFSVEDVDVDEVESL